jgi:hypothetical protein
MLASTGTAVVVKTTTTQHAEFDGNMAKTDSNAVITEERGCRRRSARRRPD